MYILIILFLFVFCEFFNYIIYDCKLIHEVKINIDEF